jgi:hypothetical protein
MKIIFLCELKVSKDDVEELDRMSQARHIVAFVQDSRAASSNCIDHLPQTSRQSGPGRIPTCNQTVMSGGIWISFVNLSAFSFEFDRVSYVSVTSDAKLVRLSDLSFTENIVSSATLAKSRMSGS